MEYQKQYFDMLQAQANRFEVAMVQAYCDFQEEIFACEDNNGEDINDIDRFIEWLDNDCLCIDVLYNVQHNRTRIEIQRASNEWLVYDTSSPAVIEWYYNDYCGHSIHCEVVISTRMQECFEEYIDAYCAD